MQFLHNTHTFTCSHASGGLKDGAVSGLVLFCFLNSEININSGDTVSLCHTIFFIAQDSEETLLDECPLEEVPVSA